MYADTASDYDFFSTSNAILGTAENTAITRK